MSLNTKYVAKYWSPKIPIVNRFEEYFDVSTSIEFMNNNWRITIFFSILYLILVFVGTRAMKSRKPFKLQAPLFVWNSILAIFSLFGSIHCVSEAIYALSRGSHYFFCDNKNFLLNNTLNTWNFWFSISKIFEFGDTFFIVVRKQKLTFLHYIHHAITAVYCFYVFGNSASIMRFGSAMNFSIHTLMYSYYALKSLRIRIPQYVSVLITSLQILQMIVGLCGMSYILVVKLTKHKYCNSNLSAAIFGFSVYLLFFILFCNFFIKSYLRENTSKSEIKKKI